MGGSFPLAFCFSSELFLPGSQYSVSLPLPPLSETLLLSVYLWLFLHRDLGLSMCALALASWSGSLVHLLLVFSPLKFKISGLMSWKCFDKAFDRVA